MTKTSTTSTPELQGKRILLGVTGGVAAYKAAVLLRELQTRGATVQVVMTQAAQQFVGTATFQALSGDEVFTDAWDTRIPNVMPHIELSRRADLVLIAPATADFMAKIANGLCDDLLSTLCIASNKPVAMAPAMNHEMWAHPATQRNIKTLAGDGTTLIGPDAGDQACGETGLGRMLEPFEIAEAVTDLLTPKRLAGRRVVLTAGPTYEPIDPVRVITNLSSGKMGFELARAMSMAGATVELIAGPCHQRTPDGVKRINVNTAVQMHRAVMAACEARPDVFVGVAAVADWRVSNASDRKIKKTSKQRTPALTFEENPDILSEVAALPSPPYCVGFAAESQDLLENATAKRLRKNVPLLIANIGPATFGLDDNQLILIDEHGHRSTSVQSKRALAAELVKEIAQRLPTTAGFELASLTTLADSAETDS
ncbi:MAG: bifunctional phosphopantothenoylcysteine decarboxylase/phosphopantothenate--cysteine ligase CoaBC [Burkholderiaceae bacterium]